MARSSVADPLEKFRFKVTVISVDLSVTGAVDLIAAATGAQKLSVLTRAGFSEIVLPKVTMNEMSYRENIDNQRFSKSPGLAKYEPVVLRRGVAANSGGTINLDLWNWYRLVNDDTLLTGAAQELTKATTATPAQSENFRKEILIESLDREGNSVKQWMLFNAFPLSYKGGNDLNASTEEKIVEELTLSYEFFLELEGGLAGLGKELAKDIANGIIGAGTTAALNAIGNPSLPPFLR